MSSKIFRSILLAAGVVLLASLLIIMGCLYEYFGGVQENQMKDELNLAAAGVEEYGSDYLQRVSSDHYRLTWINPDGTILYDTQADARDMENHADRVEVQDALEQGQGESSRYSNTLMEKTLYYAERLSDGTVLRISISRATVWLLALGMLRPILIVLAAALVLSGFLASRLSRRIVEPLNRLDLDHPLDNNAAYEELTPLLRRINYQHIEIAQQMRTLQKKTDEFNQTVRCMQEGLVLLDEVGRVLSINPAAQRMLGTDDSCVGQDFLTIDRDVDVSMAIQRAMTSGRSETRCQRAGRSYRLDISRIDSEGASLGTVLLAFDVTEEDNAERSRREFTANVSHELKTPLQGIIGSAELIEKGMVEPADVPRFIGHIRTEASRMVALVGDIIRLSQLDEGVAMPCEDVELLSLAQEVEANLRGEASKRQVTLAVSGEAVCVRGVRRLLYEILYNLSDNAIKYNVEKGRVDVRVGMQDGAALLVVQDTGIGIPPADQGRVFERFYRVDKSHSKASGGTGLGLSIVKHAVQYHHGKVELQSEPGKGTTMRVLLPMDGVR